MYFRYLTRELRRRARSASVVVIGLALGVGLVVTVVAASAGVGVAQEQVLHSLYGVGTDITVTEAATPGAGGTFHFGPGSGSGGRSFNSTHLASPAGLSILAGSDVTAISRMRGVAGATGTLSLTSVHFSGTFPTPGQGAGTAPGSSSGSNPFSVTVLSVEGVDPHQPGLGPLSAGDITAGSKSVAMWFELASDGRAANQLLALVDRSYAKQNSIEAGSSLSVGGTSFKVEGLISTSGTTTAADVFLPLGEAQKLAGDEGKVNGISVTAGSASQISSVQKEIQKRLPKATVTTTQDLASQITGSLSTAAGLADSLGVWLAVIVLLGAFVLAALLTSSSVGRRVREFGTLKAMGWRSRRIVGQVLGESVVLGAVGAAIGVGLGFLGSFLVARAAGTLKATVNPAGAGTGPAATRPFGAGGGGFGGFGGGSSGSSSTHHSFVHTFALPTHTVSLHLTAPLAPSVFGLAIGLAIAGGLIAGILGGWRAARLRPAEALRRVE